MSKLKHFPNVESAIRHDGDVISFDALGSYFQLNKRFSFYAGRPTKINNFYLALKKAFVRAQPSTERQVSYYLGHESLKIHSDRYAKRTEDLSGGYSKRAIAAGHETSVEIPDGPFVFDCKAFQAIFKQRFSHIDSDSGKSPAKTLTKKASVGVGLALLNEAWFAGMDIAVVDINVPEIESALRRMKDSGAAVKLIIITHEKGVESLQAHLAFADEVEIVAKSGEVIAHRKDGEWSISKGHSKALAHFARASGLSGKSQITNVKHDPNLLAFPSRDR